VERPQAALGKEVVVKIFELERSQRFPLPVDEVFEFFSDPHNLERITPEFLRFRILTPGPLVVTEGLRIDYALRLRGVPIRWRSEISRWNPPHGFVDRQLRGPYRLWVHSHRFEPDGDGTLVHDHVRYAVPGGALVHRLLVRPDLERIFDHRQLRLERILAADCEVAA
jgi:ligand-binding SRPBCC domain-containing protein